MGGDGKRKTRRGKRGGESKRTKDDKEPTDPKSTADEVYTAPPMDNNDSLFFIDTGASHTNNNNNDDDDDMAVDQEDKISPASYGLVNPDLQSYLKNCEAMLDSPTFESAEMQIMFVNNVYAEMKGFELQLTTDHEGSRILEKLFRISSAFQIRRFFALTREDAVRLAIHRFSSHTIQTLLLLSAVALERGETSDLAEGAEIETEDDNGHVRTEVPTFEELLLALVETLAPKWAFLMANEYASHILRVLLLVLSGAPIEDQSNPKNSIKSRRSAKYVEDRNGEPISHPALSAQRTVPASLTSALTSLLAAFDETTSDLVARGFTSSPVGSPVLQLMLTLQRKQGRELERPNSLLDKCLMGLVSDPASENARRDAAISLMLEDTVASHFLQRVIELASARLLQTLFDRYFSGRLHKLAQHASANFVVQSLLANAKSERQLRAMISEVQPIIARLLFGQRAGVVRALLDSCVRLRACALEIMNALYSGLGIGQESERAELINLLAFLIPHAELAHADYERLPFRIQGALIIQSILKLPGEGSQPLVDSFLAQPHARMHSWCMDASGSRIVEALIASSSISADDRRRCLERFSTHYADLAANKYGSHIVDACWKCSDMPYKEKIMIELIQREALVQDSPFGRIVMRNCRVEQYKRRADEWRERERSLQKGKRLFKDILDDNDGDVKSKKSKKSEKTKAKKSKLNNKLK